MSPDDKPLIMLVEIKHPPWSLEAQDVCGRLLRLVQQGKQFENAKISKPMPCIWPNCHELRIEDKDCTWRAIYVILDTHVLLVHAFKKKQQKTPKSAIRLCQERIRAHLKDLES